MKVSQWLISHALVLYRKMIYRVLFKNLIDKDKLVKYEVQHQQKIL
jgi:hypothetical protein